MTVIFVKISQNVANEIPYKNIYISDFSDFENWQNDIILLLIYDTTLVLLFLTFSDSLVSKSFGVAGAARCPSYCPTTSIKALKRFSTDSRQIKFHRFPHIDRTVQKNLPQLEHRHVPPSSTS